MKKCLMNPVRDGGIIAWNAEFRAQKHKQANRLSRPQAVSLSQGEAFRTG